MTTDDGTLSPELVRAATFSQPRRRSAGFDEGEVRQLLDRAAAGWQADADAAGQARAELARLRVAGSGNAEREATLVLRTAQEVGDQVIADAQHQAKITVEDARITADRITGEAEIQAGRVKAAADIEAGRLAARIAAEAPVEAQARVARYLGFGDNLLLALRSVLTQMGDGLAMWEQQLAEAASGPPPLPGPPDAPPPRHASPPAT